jgi:hypothetical protein
MRLDRFSSFVPRLADLRLAAALLLVSSAATLTACGGTPHAGEMAVGGDSNIPNAPQIDRSKCSDRGKEIVTADTNLDKKPDVWKFFQTVNVNGQKVQVLTCKQVDLNHDGKLDLVYYYDDKGAQTTLEEFDLDFDGKFDLTVYYVNGKKVREELDTNYDQKPDLFKYYEDEKLVRIERDTNNDGKIDEWQYYEGGKLDRIGYDTQGTGKVDKWDRQPEADESPAEGSAAPAPATPAPAKGPATATTPPGPATPPPPTAPPAPATPSPAKAAAKPAAATAPVPVPQK